MRRRIHRCAAIALALAMGVAATATLSAATATGLSPELQKALESAQYVYIASTRKDGSLGEKAEIWFMYDNGTVYVGTRPTSWRVKRIEWGRPKAKIWVGSPNGPSFEATGSLVKDPALQEKMFEAYAKKYPDGWKTHEAGFRNGFKDGSRVMVAYKPVS